MEPIGLIPLRNFGIVDKRKHIYRSAQPLYFYEYRWLKNVLGIKKIFDLRMEDLDHKLTHSLGMEIVQFRIKDHHPPTLFQAKKFIEDIKELKQPALIHCTHGYGRTSTFTILSRIALGWTVEEAIREEKNKFHYQFHHELQEDFLLKNFK